MSDTDERRFLAAVEGIYDAAPDPSRWPHALQLIADVFHDVGAVLVFGRDDGSFGAIGSVSMEPMLQDYWSGPLAGQDLRAIRGRESGFYLGRDAVSDPDIVSIQEMETHPFYRFMAKHGLKYFVAAPISPDPRVAASIAVQRSIDKPPYVAQDLETMARLGRYAEKSLRLSIRLLNAELSNLGLQEALSRLDIGIFALDAYGRIIFSNDAANQMAGDGIHVIDQTLSIRGTAGPDFETAIQRALECSPADLLASPKPILVHRSGSARPVTVYVLPIVQRRPEEDFLTHAKILVMAIDPEAGSPPDPAIVRDVLGLTLAEARVASLVSSGVSPREAARKLGIAEETARTALKRVFSKVGVSRQSELAALLGRLVLR